MVYPLTFVVELQPGAIPGMLSANARTGWEKSSDSVNKPAATSRLRPFSVVSLLNPPFVVAVRNLVASIGRSIIFNACREVGAAEHGEAPGGCNAARLFGLKIIGEKA